MLTFNRIVLPLLLPITVLAATLLLPYQALLPPSLAGILEYGPYLILAIVGSLSVAFNRGKVLLASVLFLSGYLVVNWLPDQPGDQANIAAVSEFSLYALLPLNLALVGLYRERGILSLHGCLRSAVILIQIAAVIALVIQPQPDLFVLLAGELLALENAPWPALPLPASQLILLILAVSVIGTVTTAYGHNTPLSFALLGALGGYLLGLFNGESFSIYIMAASLILCLGILRDSYNNAYRDELTGLPQRRALNEQMMSLGRNYSLAMLDVDHFKKFNDSHGHDVGDQVLQMVAGQINKVGGGGKAYRYGGEEFSVIFPRKAKSDSFTYLDEVCQRIEAYQMVIRDDKRLKKPDQEASGLRSKGSFRRTTKKVSVTISIGVADRNDRSEKPDDVLKKADQALYKAKQTGRNRVVA